LALFSAFAQIPAKAETSFQKNRSLNLIIEKEALKMLLLFPEEALQQNAAKGLN